MDESACVNRSNTAPSLRSEDADVLQPYLHLMQMYSNGPLYTTTVLAQETTEGRMMAIHTRLEYSPATVPGFGSRPETYYGDCAVGN